MESKLPYYIAAVLILIAITGITVFFTRDESHTTSTDQTQAVQEPIAEATEPH